MRAVSAQIFAERIGGQLLGELADVQVRRVTVDSRRPVRPSTAFFALRGAQRDGHRYVAEALAAGCAVAVIREQALPEVRAPLGPGSEARLVVVPELREEPHGDSPGDPVLAALGRLAVGCRDQLGGRVLAITGSNGKTTVKDALRGVLDRRFRVDASPGSWNSRLGVALSLVAMDPAAEVVLVEAGVSAPGDMAPLAEMIRPDLGLWTGLGTAHLGAFGSREAIGLEKRQLFEGLAEAAWLLLPDEPRCRRLAEPLCCARVPFGAGRIDGAAVEVTRRSTTRRMGQVIRLRFADRSHYDIELRDTSPAQVQNVAAAASGAALLGVPPAEIADALDGFRPPPRRFETLRTPGGVIVINDGYSSDPSSTDAALRALGQMKPSGERIFVFGGMAGLGAASEDEHQHVSRLARSVGVSRLVAVGPLARKVAEIFEGDAARVDSPEAALETTRRRLSPGDVVLVKGPSDQRLHQVVEGLLDSAAPTRLLVDLTAVEANVRQLARRVGPSVRLCAVVKAEAYGGDPIRLARHLEHVGVDQLAVAFTEEGAALRRAGIGLPILVLASGRGDADRMVHHRLTPVVHSRHAIPDLEEAAARRGRPVQVHLEIDTGMGRLGLFPEEALPAARKIQASRWLHLEGLMTHFAAAEDPAEDPFTREQIARFRAVSDALVQAGIRVPIRHAAATAGALRFAEARFEMIRVGLGLYGVLPSPACRDTISLEPAVAALSRITSIKTFPAGHTIGYGRRYRVGPGPERVGFIPCGYHDAVVRELSRGGGEVIVRGTRCPLVGTASMDSAQISLAAAPEADVGDDVLLFGAWQDQALPIEEVAARAGTVAHHLLSSIGPRVLRIYQEG